MAKVFISYRREDAATYAQEIYRELARHLQRDQIFMDVDTIEPGVDFVDRIEQAVRESDVVIAVIGRRWTGERENARPRIDAWRDLVHREIATALAGDIRVIPVLVGGARLPRMDELPRTLHPLLRCRALELRNSHFSSDLERISHAVKSAVGAAKVEKRSGGERRPWTWYGKLSVVLIVLALVASLWVIDREKEQSARKEVDQPPAVAPSAALENKQPVKEESPAEKEQQKREGIRILLARGSNAEAKNRLTTPAEDNAADYYREVLRLDPDNSDAQQGLKRIGEKYVAWAEQALDKGQLDLK